MKEIKDSFVDRDSARETARQPIFGKLRNIGKHAFSVVSRERRVTKIVTRQLVRGFLQVAQDCG
jgi:hypothetical protein